MIPLKEFVPKDIIFTLGGVPIQGFEEGGFITISKVEDSFSFKSGIEGDGIRINKQNNFYSVTFTLLMTSASNDYLSALATADNFTPGVGKVGISINNLRGRELFAATEAWVTKLADTAYSGAADPKQWVMNVFNPVYNPGGS